MNHNFGTDRTTVLLSPSSGFRKVRPYRSYRVAELSICDILAKRTRSNHAVVCLCR